MSVWTYEVKTGVLLSPSGEMAGRGYSGHGIGLNNPDHEADRAVGPIPVGMWSIDLHPLEHTSVGPLALALSPLGHNAHGRSLFRIHGDNRSMNHSASHGCIILARPIRQAIIDSGVNKLNVVHG